MTFWDTANVYQGGTGVGLTPYSPLAKGRAARPWGEQTARSSADTVAKAFDRDVDKPVVDAIQKVADAAQWWLHNAAALARMGWPAYAAGPGR